MPTAIFLLALVALLLGTPDDAFAYLDPASGSMILQIVLAGVAGLLVLLKMFWRRILTFLGVRKPAAAQSATGSGSGNEPPVAPQA